LAPLRGRTNAMIASSSSSKTTPSTIVHSSEQPFATPSRVARRFLLLRNGPWTAGNIYERSGVHRGGLLSHPWMGDKSPKFSLFLAAPVGPRGSGENPSAGDRHRPSRARWRQAPPLSVPATGPAVRATTYAAFAALPCPRWVTMTRS
jgi:hypothetical protein